MGVWEPWISSGEVQRSIYHFSREIGRHPLLEELAERLVRVFEIGLIDAKRTIVAALVEEGPGGGATFGLGWLFTDAGEEIEQIAIGPHLNKASRFFLAHVDWDRVVCYVNPKDVPALEEWYAVTVSLGIGESELAVINGEILDLKGKCRRLKEINERQDAQLSEWLVDGQVGSSADQW